MNHYRYSINLRFKVTFTCTGIESFVFGIEKRKTDGNQYVMPVMVNRVGAEGRFERNPSRGGLGVFFETTTTRRWCDDDDETGGEMARGSPVGR